MKFFAKDPASPILGIAYQSGHNDELRGLLRDEQRGYCAYTEKRFSSLDSVDVEHFDDRLKGTSADGYYNYYATLHSANKRKRRKTAKHRGASFFETKFFQQPGGFERRVQYLAEGAGVYEEIDPSDEEARALIDYLGLNDHDVSEERRKHVARLRDLFAAAGWGRSVQIEHLSTYRDELSFPTALSAELGLDLDPLL